MQTLADARRAADEERVRLERELAQLTARTDSEAAVAKRHLEDAVRALWSPLCAPLSVSLRVRACV